MSSTTQRLIAAFSGCKPRMDAHLLDTSMSPSMTTSKSKSASVGIGTPFVKLDHMHVTAARAPEAGEYADMFNRQMLKNKISASSCVPSAKFRFGGTAACYAVAPRKNACVKRRQAAWAEAAAHSLAARRCNISRYCTVVLASSSPVPQSRITPYWRIRSSVSSAPLRKRAATCSGSSLSHPTRSVRMRCRSDLVASASISN